MARHSASSTTTASTRAVVSASRAASQALTMLASMPPMASAPAQRAPRSRSAQITVTRCRRSPPTQAGRRRTRSMGSRGSASSKVDPTPTSLQTLI